MCCENCCTRSTTEDMVEYLSEGFGDVWRELDALRTEREEARKDIYTRISQDESRLVDLERHVQRRLTELEDHVRFGTKPR